MISSRYRSTRHPATISFLAEPDILCCAISRIVSTDSCLAVSMKLQVFTTRISAWSTSAVSRAPARSSSPIITSESTRFFGQPKEIKPTEGAVGADGLVTLLLYRGRDFSALRSQSARGHPHKDHPALLRVRL